MQFRKASWAGKALTLLQSLALAALALPALAQEVFPNKPVNLIVPFGPGAATDTAARIVAEGLARQLGQPVVVVNRPGANGQIAIRSAQGLPADGYTLLFLANGVVIDQVIKKNAGFDVRKDITPVARVVQAPLGLFSSNQLPVNSVRELIDYAKKNPGKVNFASSGVGSIAHLTTERLKLAAGLDMVHVPYPAGTAPILTALLAGDVGVFVNEMGSMKGFVSEKKIKLLATLADQRSTIYPDAPAVSELGIPELRGIFTPFFFGIFVVPGTDNARVETVANAVNKALAEPAVRERMVGLGYNPALLGGTTPTEFRKVLNDELARVESIVKAANIPAQ